MPPLSDGTYEVIVVDAEEIAADARGEPADDAPRASIRLELVVTAGDHKGELVRLAVTNFERDALSLLGLPGTLRVVDGAPNFTAD
jgi:hypothetical protein